MGHSVQDGARRAIMFLAGSPPELCPATAVSPGKGGFGVSVDSRFGKIGVMVLGLFLIAATRVLAQPDQRTMTAIPEPAPRKPINAVPARPKIGWVGILTRTYHEVVEDRVLAVAAGVTYYALLAVFPAVTLFVSAYGLFADRSTVNAHLESLQSILPDGALTIVGDQMSRIAGGSDSGLGLAAAFGLVLSLWSSNAGTKAMIEALNIAHDVTESRSFVMLNLRSALFTFGAIATVMVLIGAVAVIPLVLQWFFLDALTDWLLWAGRWPLVFSVLFVAVTVFYRFGPDRPAVSWRAILPGSLGATVSLVAFSMLFSWYAANFGSYNETYGSLGAVIAFLTWLWLCTVIVIIGAELNAEIEHSAGDTQRAASKELTSPASPTQHRTPARL